MTKRRAGGVEEAHDPLVVARWCGDLEGAETDAIEAPSTTKQAALDRLDGIAGHLFDDAPLMTAPAIRFAIADDVENKHRRLRAIVARTYARADALAWCRARADEDADTLLRQAKAIERALHTIDPEYKPGVDYDDTAGVASPGWWMRNGAPLAAADRALRATRFDTVENRAERSATVVESCVTLSEYAATLRRTASSLRTPGRPRDTPRHWFVLRLAEIYALTFGKVPVFDGGTAGRAFDRGGARMTKNPWHELIDAAFDLTGIRGAGGTTNAALRAVAVLGGSNPNLPPDFFVRRLSTFVDRPSGSDRESFCQMEYGRLPSAGLEIDLGIDVEKPPRSRGEAYAPASLSYRGRAYGL